MINKDKEKEIQEINAKMESCLDDLDKLNRLYTKEYITVGEFDIIKNRILDKMIELSNQEKAVIERRWK